MTLWSSDMYRVRLPSLRAAMMPSEFAKRDQVPLVIGPHTVTVRIVVVDGMCRGGRRRWLCCPRCERRTVVIGLDPFSGIVGCRRCLKWRSRRTIVPAPHTRGPVEIVR